jgi:hypothetical protein
MVGVLIHSIEQAPIHEQTAFMSRQQTHVDATGSAATRTNIGESCRMSNAVPFLPLASQHAALKSFLLFWATILN